MSAGRVLADLRALGVTATVAGNRLRYRPASAVPPALAAAVYDAKPQIRALLIAEEAEIAWRAAALRAQAPTWASLASLAVWPVPHPDGACQSCGDPLAAGRRCPSCGLAVHEVRGDLRREREAAAGDPPAVT